MLDLEVALTDATNVLFPDGLAWCVPAKSKIFRLATVKYNVKGKSILWRPSDTAAEGSAGWDDANLVSGDPTPIEARFTFMRDYVACVIDSEADMATESAGGFDGASETAIEIATHGAVKQHALSVKSRFIGNGGGARAQIAASSNVSSDTLTLVNPESAALFLRKMWVQSAADDGSGASPGGLTAGGAAIQVAAPRTRAGTIKTLDGTHWDVAIPGIATGDYLFRKGDYALAWYGLGAHIPNTVPTAGDSHGGLDRSVNPDKLAGLLVDNLPANNIVEAVFNIREAMEANIDEDQEGETKMLTAVMSNRRISQLLNSVQTQGRYQPPGGEAKLGASDFVFDTPWGKINAIGETAWPQDEILLGDLSAFEVCVRQTELPKWFDRDGRIWRHTGTKGDSIEAYMHSHIATRVLYPSRFARGLL